MLVVAEGLGKRSPVPSSELGSLKQALLASDLLNRLGQSGFSDFCRYKSPDDTIN